jgi:hypothetical protein
MNGDEGPLRMAECITEMPDVLEAKLDAEGLEGEETG